MNLYFKINKHYLLAHALGQPDIPFLAWKKIKDKLWEKFPRAFYLLTFHSEAIFIGSDSLNGLDDANKEAKSFIKGVLKSNEFKRLYKETEKYLVVMKKQWSKNKKEAFNILEDISGLKMSKKQKITVLVTHPKLRNGVNFPLFNTIGWGHSEDWKNYSTAYLCHEIIHLLTFSKSKNHEIMHALIELMTDNELRIRLNKKGRYFKEDNLDIGHPHFKKLEKQILPYWKEYLKDRKEKNIFDLEKELSIKFKK